MEISEDRLGRLEGKVDKILICATQASDQANSAQKELTEHKSNHKWFIGICLTGCYLIMAIMEYFKK